MPPTVDTWGTIFVNGHWIDEHDPNSFEKVVLLPQITEARMYDRRDNRKLSRRAWVYDLHLSDQVMYPGAPTQHIRVAVQKDDYPTEAEALSLAVEYGKAVGRLPYALRWNVNHLTINGGENLWGGGGHGLLVHAGYSHLYKEFHKGDIIDETMVHEAGHTSLDI